MTIAPGNSEQLIWPGPTLELPRYGNDPVYTEECHTKVWEAKQSCVTIPDKALPYDIAAHLAPHQAQALQNSIVGACGHNVGRILPARLAPIYHSAYKLNVVAWLQQVKKIRAAPMPNVGREFEDAVAARVLTWLNTAPSHITTIIQSVWRNVKISRQDNPAIITAEFDIVILLKNGILLHLECKSYDADLKDMEARLAVLHRSTSNMAKIAICVPVYGFANAPWYPELLGNIEKIKKWPQFGLINFTLPGQPGQSFEQSVETWLGKFVPV